MYTVIIVYTIHYTIIYSIQGMKKVKFTPILLECSSNSKDDIADAFHDMQPPF